MYNPPQSNVSLYLVGVICTNRFKAKIIHLKLLENQNQFWTCLLKILDQLTETALG